MYALERTDSSYALKSIRQSPHHELEDNGGFANFKLLIII